ncbi:MAG: UbiD family decarboxylase, partial [Sphingomonadales bacterium]|nr:UbiD family decarboxylase [Sphingomonadales bacterium]
GLCRSTALADGARERGQSPVLWFERVGDSPFSVVANVFGTRQRAAFAMGVPESELLAGWGRLGDKLYEPELVKGGPILDTVLAGADVDLARLPIPRHFAEDGGAYITNGILVAKNADNGVRNASFHRMQLKGRNLLGTSLHSRRHLWSYARRAQELGQDLPVVVIIGCHPLMTFGSGLWKGPIDTDEYNVAGGFLGGPLKVVHGPIGKVEIPIECEIALEGTICLGERGPEGPFAEFTGYASERSTEHVLRIDSILYRKDAIFQDIVPGISDEHTLLLAFPQEARLLRTLHQHHPNVTAVAYPKSGTCRFHAYVAVRNPAEGQARNIGITTLGDDLSLKLVVVVDDDVDVTKDFDVLWAMATRMQADSDMDLIRNAMGAVLDPSNRQGTTAKLIVDATRKTEPFPRRHTLPQEATARAHALLSGYKPR